MIKLDYIKYHLKKGNYRIAIQELEPVFSVILGVIVVGLFVWGILKIL